MLLGSSELLRVTRLSRPKFQTHGRGRFHRPDAPESNTGHSTVNLSATLKEGVARVPKDCRTSTIKSQAYVDSHTWLLNPTQPDIRPLMCYMSFQCNVNPLQHPFQIAIGPSTCQAHQARASLGSNVPSIRWTMQEQRRELVRVHWVVKRYREGRTGIGTSRCLPLCFCHL